ncbi:MAG: hypothetical protein JWP25_6606 [Bradyrhizobium sp.]|nr:hypothetical protein [Bradyrhizobium sp.]
MAYQQNGPSRGNAEAVLVTPGQEGFKTGSTESIPGPPIRSYGRPALAPDGPCAISTSRREEPRTRRRLDVPG